MARSWLALLVFLVVTFAAAAIGSSFTASSVGDWYPTLARPTWAPPDWVFGPVWTVLYALMAVAAWLVWRQRGIRGASVALGLYAGQLIANAAWSVLFFGLRDVRAAFADIVVLWVLIVLTLVAFWRRSFVAGLFITPYLAWVSFAALLNGAIWVLNGPRP